MSAAMHDLLKLALAALFGLSVAAHAHAAEWKAYTTARVDALVEEFRTQARPYSSARVPSLSLAVGIDGRLALAKGYGEARPGYLATEHSVYHIGSLTKQFTAAAILRLIEAGARAPLSRVPIALNTPVAEIFHGVENWRTGEAPPITIRGLLTMTSALPSLTDHPPLTADPWGTITAGRMLDELKKLSTASRSSGFAYSNSSYFLLAEIVEAAGGPEAAGYRAFLRSAILERAGLRETGFIGDYAPGTALEVATPSWGPRTPVSRKRPAYVEQDWLKGSADMASSSFDLFAWNKALMEDRVVSGASRELMFSAAARAGRSRYYGMGWFVEHADGSDRFSHTGYVPGFSSLNMIVRPRRGGWLSVTLLTNGDSVQDLDRLAVRIAEAAQR